MRGALLCGNGLGLSDSRWGTLASGFMGAKDEVGLHNVCVCLEKQTFYVILMNTFGDQMRVEHFNCFRSML